MTDRERELQAWVAELKTQAIIDQESFGAVRSQLTAAEVQVAVLTKALRRIRHGTRSANGHGRQQFVPLRRQEMMEIAKEALALDTARDWLADARAIPAGLAFLEPMAQILSTYKTDAAKAPDRILFVLGGDGADAAITVGDVMRAAEALAPARAREWLET